MDSGGQVIPASKRSVVPSIAAAFLVQMFRLVVMADPGVRELVAAEDEAVGPDVAHQRTHSQEGWLVVFREVQLRLVDSPCLISSPPQRFRPVHPLAGGTPQIELPSDCRVEHDSPVHSSTLLSRCRGR